MGECCWSFAPCEVFGEVCAWCEEWSGLIGFELGCVVVGPLGYGFGVFWLSQWVVVGSWSLVDCNWELVFV